MSGVYPWGGGTVAFDQLIPTKIYDIQEWVSDSYIDGPLGQNCTLVYPDKWTQCDNCIFDLGSNRSSNIYKVGGPQSFPANSLCPRCNGVGRLQEPVSEVIRMRVYWERRSWVNIGIKIANPDGVAMCIGYFRDLPKLERANVVLLQSDLKGTKVYECVREGEGRPHGMRKNRYFIQYMRRTGSG